MVWWRYVSTSQGSNIFNAPKIKPRKGQVEWSHYQRGSTEVEDQVLEDGEQVYHRNDISVVNWIGCFKCNKLVDYVRLYVRFVRVWL